MKYKDYYESLGVGRGATADEIKKTYRKLAHQYHPDLTKDPNGEEKFKEIAEAYKTLKDPQKRAAYDQLGHPPPGQEFEPPPSWEQQFGGSRTIFNDIDLADLFASFSSGHHRNDSQGAGLPISGQDYEIAVQISLNDAYHGTLIDLNFSVPEYDEYGHIHRVQRSVKARIPKGAIDGQKLRLAGRGGKGFKGGRNGDLYLNITLTPHPLYRVKDHDLYMDLPLTPWEAALGTSIDVPTLAGTVRLRVQPGTSNGLQLRIGKRGLPKQTGGSGDLFALVQIVIPTEFSEHELALFKQLADSSTFNPRKYFKQETTK